MYERPHCRREYPRVPRTTGSDVAYVLLVCSVPLVKARSAELDNGLQIAEMPSIHDVVIRSNQGRDHRVVP
jgi:hypothetical protein